MVLEESLTDFGYDVQVCSDGSQAWDALTQGDPPELAVLDWMMPGMDGPEICTRFRESDNPLATYFILITVKGGREDMITGLQAGADDYIKKPVDTEELRARLRVGQRLVELQRQQVEQETERYVRQLEQTVEELRESRERIVVAQEEVRRAIAEELHGHIQTQMCLLYLRLTNVQKKMDSSVEEAKAELVEIADELDNLRENDVRQISHRLHPGMIKLGLGAGLMSLRDQYERSIPVELDIAQEVSDLEPPGSSSIPFNVRLGLYRVVEEALGNVIKHSGAGQAAVKLWISDSASNLCLSVEDNGGGFVLSEQNRRSLGLATIRDHMGAIGGSFEMVSSPGEGADSLAFALTPQ